MHNIALRWQCSLTYDGFSMITTVAVDNITYFIFSKLNIANLYLTFISLTQLTYNWDPHQDIYIYDFQKCLFYLIGAIIYYSEALEIPLVLKVLNGNIRWFVCYIKLNITTCLMLYPCPQMSKHSETPVHPHAGLSSSLWTVGVSQTDRQPPVHGQTSGIPRRHAAVGWTARCTSPHH